MALRHKLIINRECNVEEAHAVIAFLKTQLGWTEDVDFVTFINGKKTVKAATEDRTLVCQQCKKSYIFKVKDQLFYAENGWRKPKRCHVCRAVKKAFDAS